MTIKGQPVLYRPAGTEVDRPVSVGCSDCSGGKRIAANGFESLCPTCNGRGSVPKENDD